MIITSGKPLVKEIIDWTLHITIAVVIGLFIVTFVGQRTVVYGHSMEPTLQPGDQLIVEKITTRFGKIEKGDIVTIYVPEFLEGEKDTIIKRVIAIENDTVEIKDGKVYVNGQEIVEDYINGDETGEVYQEYNNLTVPEGHIFVLGDNRLPNASKDSRSIGPVDIKKVRGRAVLRFYPVKKFEVLK